MTPEEISVLRQSAANIIARQQQMEGQKAALEEELEKLKAGITQAETVAAQARADGDDAMADRFAETVDILNQQVIEIDTQIAVIDGDLIEARQASDDAKALASDSTIEKRQLKEAGDRAEAAFGNTDTFEQDVMEAEAADRLAAIRSELGITSPEPEPDPVAPADHAPAADGPPSDDSDIDDEIVDGEIVEGEIVEGELVDEADSLDNNESDDSDTI